jgi:hypothetical protein
MEVAMNVAEVIKAIASHLSLPEKDATTILNKALEGGEIKAAGSTLDWYERRFLPNCVLIDERGYAEMCIDALKIASTTAATDYGSSRQRDLAQLWADMTRGYLGEYAFKLFLKAKFGLDATLGHESGELNTFLPMDIHQVREEGGEYRAPRIPISVKATKWNGIWLDIPGDQFSHSFAHVLIKVGTGRDHLFSYFKLISVFRDKILKKGMEIGSLDPAQADKLYDAIPDFSGISAYVCGFVLRDKDGDKAVYEGKKGRKNYEITSWFGKYAGAGDLSLVREENKVPGKVAFAGIGVFSHSGYLFNTGNLRWKEDDWAELATQI